MLKVSDMAKRDVIGMGMFNPPNREESGREDSKYFCTSNINIPILRKKKCVNNKKKLWGEEWWVVMENKMGSDLDRWW